MTPLYSSLIVLAVILAGIFLLVLGRTSWKQEGMKLKGLALPEGSVRGLIAFLVIGAFVIFVFFGKGAVTTTSEELMERVDTEGKLVTIVDTDGNPIIITNEDTTLFTTVLASLSTLAGAVTGFYFAGRTAETAAGAGKPVGADGKQPEQPK